MNHNQCKRIEVELTLPLLQKGNIITSFHNIQEYYITFDSNPPLELDVYEMAGVLLVLIKQHLNVLYFTIDINSILPCDSITQESEIILSEIEEGLQTNTTLHELNVDIQFELDPGYYYYLVYFADVVNSVINGVTRNKSIQTFSFACLSKGPYLAGWEALPEEHNPLKSKTIKHLLRDNHILQALKLNIDDHLMPSLDIVEVYSIISMSP